MTEVLSLIIQGGAFGLLTYIVIAGIPAVLKAAGLIVKALAHQDETVAKFGRALIHLTYKIKNPWVNNSEDLSDLDKELLQHMLELSDSAKQNLLASLQKEKG